MNNIGDNKDEGEEYPDLDGCNLYFTLLFRAAGAFNFKDQQLEETADNILVMFKGI